MKKLSILAIVAAMSVVACKENKSDKVTTNEAQEVAQAQGETYAISTENSTVKWTAAHKGGFNPRFGVVKTAGTLSVENGGVTGGSLTADMNTLTTDPAAVAASEGKKSTDLDDHLKSADFFDVATYPSVKFDITKVEELPAGTESKIEGANKWVSGNLTIKDKTVNVSFPAKVEMTDNQVSLVSKFSINRQDWGLTYGTEGDPKDWMISQEVEMDLNLVATK